MCDSFDTTATKHEATARATAAENWTDRTFDRRVRLMDVTFEAGVIALPDSETIDLPKPPPLPKARATARGITDIDIVENYRRNSARTRLHMPVNVTRATDRSSRTMYAFDIGLGGIQCQSKIAVFPGTYLDLAFRLPGTRELLKVGAQVASLGETPDGDITLGLRFCRLSARAQLSIYRFLDKRRERWTSQGETDTVADMPRPFEALLKDAYSALQAEELRELGFVCTPWPQSLMPGQVELLKTKDVKPVVLQ